jgi:bla regulator protein blaR1
VVNASLHLVLTLVVCTLAVSPLAAARWPWRSPRVGIALWQSLAATWVLCAVGSAVCVGLAPFHVDVPTAVTRLLRNGFAGLSAAHVVALGIAAVLTGSLLAAFAVAWIGVLRSRRRHRRVLDLVARTDPAAPGAQVLDHPVAVAYCVPGLRSRVVLSSGTLRALTDAELAAVLAHERTHARERHDLVLLPFTALRRLLPRSRLVAEAAAVVGLLVEMRADDAACRGSDPDILRAALRRFGDPPAPAGALGMADTAVRARVHRLAGLSPLPVVVRILVLATGLLFVSTPLSFLVV